MTELDSEGQAPAVLQADSGSRLARAREAQDMSVADVARALRLGIKQIEALEANDLEKLPGRTFVRGFVRNYARLVNLDPDQLVAEYFPLQQETETKDIQAPSQRISFSEHHRKPWLKWLATSFVLVALISWGVLVWLGPESAKPVEADKAAAVTEPAFPREIADPADAVMPEPAALPEKTVEPALPAVEKTDPPASPAPLSGVVQARVLFSFSGHSWVEVLDRNGKKLHSQNNPAGTQQTVEGEPPLSLVIGSAPNVKLTYKGQPVDLAAFTKAEVARLTLE